jgi:hypothetical protein
MHPMNAKIILLSTSLVLAASTAAQQPIEAPKDDAQKELIELFGKVENRLREIDKLLSDAGAGDTSALKNVGPAGIDELLKSSKASGEQAVKDIDRILEIAREMGQRQQDPQSGSGQPQQQPGSSDGKSPMDKQGDPTTQREETPEGPQPGGQEPKPQGQKPGDEKNQPKPDGNDPKNPQASNDKNPKNQRGGPPNPMDKDQPANPSDQRDRWGDLPVHARDVFRNEGGRDMPVQYREWIDAYYKRLNKKP